MLKQINWRYAAGEVIIDIIGITLAFALNNWGANLQKQQAKQKYLERLIVDLDNEMEHLKGNMQQFERNIANINQGTCRALGGHSLKTVLCNNIYLLFLVPTWFLYY